MKIKSIKKIKNNSKRYDITTKQTHNYFANNILVHNSNICAYSYADFDGKRYITFKTRLTPILRGGNFGDFAGMWKELIEKNPQLTLRHVPDVLNGTYALSFELYGGRNPHLIQYHIPLDFRLLFGIRQNDWCIELPSRWEEYDLHHNEVLATFKGNTDITAFYEKQREEAQAHNKEAADGTIEGTEGFVFYVLTEHDRHEMFKCKPEMVEAIHWKSDMIPMGSIVTTVINAVEDYQVSEDENLLKSESFFNHILTLLKEEFTDAQIEKSHGRIKHGLLKGVNKLFLRRDVENALKKVDVTRTKNEIMRDMSQFFDRTQMSQVFNAMREMGIFK